MPTITSLPFDSKVISLSVERDNARSKGIHLSTILKDMLVTAGIQRKVKGRQFTPEEQHLLFEQGFLWENLVAEYIASPENQCIEWDRFVTKGLVQLTQDSIDKSGGSLVRPGECCMDGIYMTPDAANLKLWFLEEWKATGIMPNNFSIPEKKPEWVWQTASYCRFYKMNRAVIRVWHYRALPPVVTQWILEWTEEEIENTWRSVLTHYTYMKERDGSKGISTNTPLLG